MCVCVSAFVRISLLLFVTCGDEDVGEDDESRQEETSRLRNPPPQVAEHGQSQDFGGKING